MKYEKTVDGSLALDENLTSVIKIVIGNFDYVDTLTITLSEDGSAYYAEALSKNYVAALPQITMTAEELQAYVDADPADNNTLDGTTLTVYLDINFKEKETTYFDISSMRKNYFRGNNNEQNKKKNI